METSTYSQLLKKIKKIPVFELRVDSVNIKEFVVKSDCLTELQAAFEKFFGANSKAPGKNPSSTDKKHAAFLGGIREDQALYYAEKEGYAHCAMLWPWSDGRRYTVKLAQNHLS